MNRANTIFDKNQKYPYGLEIVCVYKCDCIVNTEWFSTQAELDTAIKEYNFKIIKNLVV